MTLCNDELLGFWEREGSGAGLVIGLSDASSKTGDVAADLAAGRTPSPLPGSGIWELEEWHEDTPPEEFVERLGTRSVRAFRAAMRAVGGDARLGGYLLAVEKGGVRWRICVTLEPSGDDWRARAADNGLAAIVFRWLKLS